MKTIVIAAVLTFGLAGCAGTEVRDETPGLANREIPSAIRNQSYTPSGIGTGTSARAESAAGGEPQAAPSERPAAPPPRARRGSSSPPPLTPYTSPPVTPTPSPTTDQSIAGFKRDQARSELDRLRNDPTTLTPEPWRQREMMNQQLELDRLEMQRR